MLRKSDLSVIMKRRAEKTRQYLVGKSTHKFLANRKDGNLCMLTYKVDADVLARL